MTDNPPKAPWLPVYEVFTNPPSNPRRVAAHAPTSSLESLTRFCEFDCRSRGTTFVRLDRMPDGQ